MQASRGNGNSSHVKDGFFVDTATIKSIKSVSGVKTPHNKYAQDCAIEIVFSLEGKDWDKNLTISGDVKRAPSVEENGVKTKGEIVGWGGAFKVERFFQSTGVLTQGLDLNENPETKAMIIPDALLNSVLGKQVKLLSYPNKNGKTTTWDIVSTPGAEPDKMVEHFMMQWQRSRTNPKGPYPKNFQPDPVETVNDPDGIEDFGFNVPENQAVSTL